MSGRVVSLWIPGPLPGTNDMLAAARSKRGNGSRYSQLKRQWTDTVCALARAARLGPPFELPVYITFTWFEKDRRRDPDNFAAGGRKIVLDGLVKAGVLLNDGWKHVNGWNDVWRVGEVPGVMVTLAEVEVVPGRQLPWFASERREKRGLK